MIIADLFMSVTDDILIAWCDLEKTLVNWFGKNSFKMYAQLLSNKLFLKKTI
jgi:hypothetical protein